MQRRTNWIVKLLIMISAAGGMTGCVTTQSGTTTPVSREIKVVNHKVIPAVSPTTGMGDPQKVAQYQAVTLSLWQVIASNCQLADQYANNPQIKKQINWYVSHPKYWVKVTTQAEPYLYYVYQQIQARNLPAELAFMPMVESAYNPFALNAGSGAAGLWQMMPGTASGFGLHVDWWYDGRRDISASTNAALDYLAYLGNFFNNDWLLAMAAYDTGEGSVQQAISRNEHAGKDTNFWGLNLARETQSYVPKIIALAVIIKNPQIYHMPLPNTPNAPYLAEVDVGSQIDLHKAAKMAGLSFTQLTALNPGYNRWATDPNGPHKLIVPVTQADRFKAQLAKLANNGQPQTTWYQVKVKKTDTIEKLAEHFKASVEDILHANKLSSHHLKVGQNLIIPQHTTPVKTVDTASSQTASTDNTSIDSGSTNTSESTIADSTANTDDSTNSNDDDVDDSDDDAYVGEKINNLPESNVIHHTVAKGETMESIARDNGVSMRAILFWNGLTSKAVTPGMDLVIWPPKINKTHITYRLVTYKVKKGDTISSIARHHHVNEKLLVKMNHIKHNHVKPGQVLRLPQFLNTAHDTAASKHQAPKKNHETKHNKNAQHNKPTKTLKHTKASKSPHAPSTTHYKAHATHHAPVAHSKTQHHTVKTGETVYSISREYHMSPEQLKKLNHLHSNTVKPGEKLTVN